MVDTAVVSAHTVYFGCQHENTIRDIHCDCNWDGPFLRPLEDRCKRNCPGFSISLSLL